MVFAAGHRELLRKNEQGKRWYRKGEGLESSVSRSRNGALLGWLIDRRQLRHAQRDCRLDGERKTSGERACQNPHVAIYYAAIVSLSCSHAFHRRRLRLPRLGDKGSDPRPSFRLLRHASCPTIVTSCPKPKTQFLKVSVRLPRTSRYPVR